MKVTIFNEKEEEKLRERISPLVLTRIKNEERKLVYTRVFSYAISTFALFSFAGLILPSLQRALDDGGLFDLIAVITSHSDEAVLYWQDFMYSLYDAAPLLLLASFSALTLSGMFTTYKLVRTGVKTLVLAR